MEIAQPDWDMINFETRSLTKFIKYTSFRLLPVEDYG